MKLKITDEDRKRGYVTVRVKMPAYQCIVDGKPQSDGPIQERDMIFLLTKDGGCTPADVLRMPTESL